MSTSPSNRNASDLTAVINSAYPKTVATLVRVLGSVDRAEEAAQEAVVRGLKTWQRDGIPNNPVAWLVTAGRNYDVDVLRRAEVFRRYGDNVVALHDADEPLVGEDDDPLFGDDLLRLIFTCCHPSLSQTAQMSLTLKVVLGFSVEEISLALLTSKKTIEKRISRAKQKLLALHAEQPTPSAHEVSGRLSAVMHVIYLVFNQGFSQLDSVNAHGVNLCHVAIRLGRIVARLCRSESEPRALLALMLLSAARYSARTDAQGRFVPLSMQDRGLWEQNKIQEGLAIIDAIFVARPPPGSYQIQAAISALHATAPGPAETDWRQIVSLYEQLEQFQPGEVARINRAVALTFIDRCDEAEAILDELTDHPRLLSYQPFHAAAAHVYALCGRTRDAVGAYDTAIALSHSAPERLYLQEQRDKLASVGS